MVTACEAVDTPHELVSVKPRVPVPAPPLGQVMVILLSPFAERVGVPVVAVAVQLKVTPVPTEDVYVIDEPWNDCEQVAAIVGVAGAELHGQLSMSQAVPL